MIVKSRLPLAATAETQFSAFPDKPKPPNMSVAPSVRSASAALASAQTLLVDDMLANLDDDGVRVGAGDARARHRVSVGDVHDERAARGDVVGVVGVRRQAHGCEGVERAL